MSRRNNRSYFRIFSNDVVESFIALWKKSVQKKKPPESFSPIYCVQIIIISKIIRSPIYNINKIKNYRIFFFFAFGFTCILKTIKRATKTDVYAKKVKKKKN